MLKNGWWRLLLPTIGLLASFSALTAICLAGQDKPKKSAKSPAFPLSLYSQTKSDDFLGEKTCAGCHAEWAERFDRSPHALYVRNPRLPADKQGCESCHGPGKNHLDHMEGDDLHKFIFAPSKSKPQEVAQMCLRCHADALTISHWRRASHAQAGLSCTTCHFIHPSDVQQAKPGAATPPALHSPLSPLYAAVKERRHLLKTDEPTLCAQCHPREVGEFRHNFHHPVPEGRLLCSDCHELHPARATEKQKAVGTRLVADKDWHSGRTPCVNCHAEKAGPFVYEHDPVAGWSGEGCKECHRPHGSPNPKLLNSFSRGLCAQCHTDKSNNHNPGQSCWNIGCHTALHGSNTDPNLRKP